MAETMTTIYTQPTALRASQAPVQLSAGKLLRDSRDGNYLVQLTLQNCADKPILGLTVQITLTDPAGNPLEGVYEHRIGNLQLPTGSCLVEGIALADPGVPVGGFTFNVIQVGFDTGEYAVQCGPWVPVASKKKRRKWPFFVILALLLGCVAAVYFGFHIWSTPECADDSVCVICGKENEQGASHDWEKATCEAPKTCALCGKTTGKPLEHEWTEANCTEPASCVYCGQTSGEPKGHEWTDGNCTEPKSCINCGETEGAPVEHSWEAATCQDPETCTVCGQTRGGLADHQWMEPDYNTTSTCAICGETTGRSLGYPLGWCTMVESSNEAGNSGRDVMVGDFYDTRGTLHTDAVKFWTIEQAGWSDTEYAVFNLGGKYRELELTLCAAEENEAGGTTKILVYADGVLIYESGWVGNAPVLVTLDVTGVRKLYIEATTDSGVFCHCLCDGLLYAVIN